MAVIGSCLPLSVVVSGYTYVFGMVVLLGFGHSARVKLYSFVSGSKRAIPVLRNWRYVTYLYQDSPFFEIGGLHRCFPSYCAVGCARLSVYVGMLLTFLLSLLRVGLSLGGLFLMVEYYRFVSSLCYLPPGVVAMLVLMGRTFEMGAPKLSGLFFIWLRSRFLVLVT